MISVGSYVTISDGKSTIHGILRGLVARDENTIDITINAKKDAYIEISRTQAARSWE